MKPACVKARVARKSRGQKCPYGFDSRPEHASPSWKKFPEGFLFVSQYGSSSNYRIVHNAIEKYSLGISHFTGQGWNTGLKFKPFKEKPIDEILVSDSSYQSFKLKRRLLSDGLKLHICEQCGLTEWQGSPIPLELHHINGNNRDNRIENLLLLCPNCHALTEYYRGKNKVSREGVHGRLQHP